MCSPPLLVPNTTPILSGCRREQIKPASATASAAVCRASAITGSNETLSSMTGMEHGAPATGEGPGQCDVVSQRDALRPSRMACANWFHDRYPMGCTDQSTRHEHNSTSVGGWVNERMSHDSTTMTGYWCGRQRRSLPQTGPRDDNRFHHIHSSRHGHIPTAAWRVHCP